MSALSVNVLSECLELSECFLDKSECLFSELGLANSLECRTRSEFLFNSGALFVDVLLVKLGGSDGRAGRSVLDDSGLQFKVSIIVLPWRF